MTREEYNNKVYVGKHEPKKYFVWRVISPAGPEERFMVVGIRAARREILGCWDYEVHNEQGQDVTEMVFRS